MFRLLNPLTPHIKYEERNIEELTNPPMSNLKTIREENIIKLEAEIDLGKNECRVKKIDNPWMDFGYFLEVLGFMATQQQEKTIEEAAEYVKQYLLKSAKDYKSNMN